jgi:hypothetical protein
MQIDWNTVFFPSFGIAEIVVRGTLMYLGLFVIMRFMARRQAGHFGPADLLVIVVIADAAQNGLGKEYQVCDRRPCPGHDHRGLGVFDRLADLSVSGPKACPQTSVPDPGKRGADYRKANAKRNAVDRRARISIAAATSRGHCGVKLAKLEGDGRLSVLRREVPAGR